MAILISAHKIGKTARSLFEGISFSIESGQRIGLIGPNGAGKSTLLKILAGRLEPDSGNLSIQRGLRIGMLEQVPLFAPNATVHSTIMEGSRDPYDWQEISRAQMLMSKLSLEDSEQPVESLSGGWKKRLALARELMREPDLLLLDEPTNHLDLESIMWLENFIAESRFATVVITHDRLFLQRISNTILELDRRHKDGILKVNGDYSTYLELREHMLAAQEQKETKLRNTLRRETEWLRRGPQARQRKQQARIEKHGALSEEVSELTQRNVNAKVRMDFQSLEKNPKKLIEAAGISKSYGGVNVVPKMDLLITPKTRLGLLGANGAGKSTLIRLLVGLEKPDTGEVKFAENLEINYFEQNRESLDPATTVIKTVCPLGEFVDVGGVKVHAKSYLSRFLFSYDQMDIPVGKLSGGEQSRLLIARLMMKRSNLLVLDEPTNDLDMATLDVLQDVLEEFNGAVILVSHDRYFLDQVSNQILAFHKERGFQRFAELSQWEEWIESLPKPSEEGKLPLKDNVQVPRKKLSYKDQRELDGMEEKIQALENKLSRLTEEAGASDPAKLVAITREMGELQSEIDRLYARWAELEAQLNGN